MFVNKLKYILPRKSKKKEEEEEEDFVLQLVICVF